MNSKIFSLLSYLSIFVISVLIRIFYPYEIFEDVIADILLFGGGILIYQKQKATYSLRLILYSLLLISIIYVGSFWVGFFFRVLFIDDNIMIGIMYTIIDLVKIICLALIYIKLCEDIKFRKIKKYIIILILLFFIITIIPLVRTTFINEFLIVNSTVELEFWIETLKQSELIIQDMMKCVIMVILSKELEMKCINEAKNM